MVSKHLVINCIYLFMFYYSTQFLCGKPDWWFDRSRGLFVRLKKEKTTNDQNELKLCKTKRQTKIKVNTKVQFHQLGARRALQKARPFM